MLIEFKLLNFEHGYKSATDITIDQYTKIRITECHCSNIKLMSHAQQTAFSYDTDYNRIVENHPAIVGTWQETALLLIDEINIVPSKINPDNCSDTTVDDICYILSFLTGRIVCRDGKQEYFNEKRTCDASIVVSNWIFYIRRYSIISDAIQKHGLCTAFYNTLYSMQENELIAQGFYTSAVMNTIYARWFKNQEETIAKSDRRIIMNAVQRKLESSIGLSILKCIEKIIKMNLSSAIAKDILERLASNLNEPSALYQMQKFLENLDLFIENDDSSKKLKMFNQIRNRIVHSGDIYKNNSFPQDLVEQINVAIITILNDIVRYYFAYEIFGIKDDSRVSSIKTEVKAFFSSGVYNGVSIFKESFENYRERIGEQWIALGRT